MSKREDDAIREFFARLAAQKDAYTRQIVSEYRSAGRLLPALASDLWREVSQLRVLTVTTLVRLPAWAQLLTALDAVMDQGTEAAVKASPAWVETAGMGAAAFISAVTGDDEDSHTAELAALAAISLYLRRHKGLDTREKHADILARRLVLKLRPVLASRPAPAPQLLTAPKSNLSASNEPRVSQAAGALITRQIVSERVSAAAQQTLTVVNTETANVGRALTVQATGETGSWRWVTRGDGSVCPICQAEDGRIHAASEIFVLTHPNCRCISVPLVSWSVAS